MLVEQFFPLHVIAMEFVRLMEQNGPWPPLERLEPDKTRTICHVAYSPSGLSARLIVRAPIEDGRFVPRVNLTVVTKDGETRSVEWREEDLDRTLSLDTISLRYLLPAVCAMRNSFLDAPGTGAHGAD